MHTLRSKVRTLYVLGSALALAGLGGCDTSLQGEREDASRDDASPQPQRLGQLELRVVDMTQVPGRSFGSIADLANRAEVTVHGIAVRRCETGPNTDTNDRDGAAVLTSTAIQARDSSAQDPSTSVSDLELCADGEWIVLKDESMTLDLLNLENMEAGGLIAQEQLPVGRYRGFRLFVSDATAEIQTVRVPMKIPSGTAASLKILVEFEVVENGVIELDAGFDLNASLQRDGEKGWRLQPALRAVVK